MLKFAVERPCGVDYARMDWMIFGVLFRLFVVKKNMFFSDCIDPENLFGRHFRCSDAYVYQSTRRRNTEDLSTHSKPVTLPSPVQTPHISSNLTLLSF